MRATILLLLALLPGFAFSQMTLQNLKSTLEEEADLVQDGGNVAEFVLDSVHIILVTDEDANRMRLMAGVTEADKLKSKDLERLMRANFHSALDAKYAISDGVLWSVFVHPLEELGEEQALDAMFQVRNLVFTYGTLYTSTGMSFGDDEEDQGKRRR